MTSSTWYNVKNISSIDSPALLVWPDRVRSNIRKVIESAGDVSRLRPHVKTHKSPEIVKMMMDEGITKFKCATIAEAEMLAHAGARDILVAYQPVGPKIPRLKQLCETFPGSRFSCLIDNIDTANDIAAAFASGPKVIDVYIDLNVGMNRTGITPDAALELFDLVQFLKTIVVKGLHAYDGHLRDPDYDLRKQQCDDAFSAVQELQRTIMKKHGKSLSIVAGGTPTFSIHCLREGVECSPGTFIYWDKGYESILKEQLYLHAALVITRVISKPSANTLCVDLGHKAIAAENPLQNRITFLNAPDLQPVGHSEEHMIFKTSEADAYHVGDVLYGIPYHICPTVALHDHSIIIEDHTAVDQWTTVSRNRAITI